MSKSAAATIPTPEELKAQHADLVSRMDQTMWGGTAQPAKPKAPEPEPAPEPPPAPAAPPPAEPPPAEPATPPAQPAQPAPPVPAQPSLASLPKPEPAIGRADIKDAVATALEEAGIKPPPPAPPQPTVALTAKDQHILTVLQKMEGMNPRYVGIADRTIAFWKKEQEWIAEFEKSNPDKDYASTEEYETFLEKNEPQYDETDFELAKEALIEERVTKKLELKQQEETRKLTDQQRFVQEQPVIQATAHSAVVSMVGGAFANEKGEMPEALAKILQKDGKLVLDDEAAKKLQEEAPEAYEVLLETGEELSVLIQALETMARFPNIPPKRSIKLPISGRRISPVDILEDEAQELETELLASHKDKLIDGKKLVSQSEFERDIAKIQKSNASEEEKREAFRRLQESKCCIGTAEIAHGLAFKYAQKAKRKIGTLTEIVDRKVKKATPPAPAAVPTQPPTPTPAPTPTPTPAGGKPKSPAVVSQSDAPDPAKGTQVTKEQKQEMIQKSMWG